MQKGHVEKKITQKEIAIVILTSSRVIFTYRRISQRHTFCHLAFIVSEVWLPLRGRKLTLSDPVWCHGSILIAMRNPVRDDVRRTITLLQRSNISPRYRKAASNEVCVFCVALQYARYTISAQKFGNFYIDHLVQLLPLVRNDFFKNF